MEFIISAVLGLFSVFNVAQAQTLEDVRGTDSSAAVQWLAEQGIVEGYADGTFKSDQDINRVEFLKIVLEASDLVDEKCDEALSYPDVDEAQWFHKYVCSATEKGIVEGYPDGQFRPANTINFAEAAKIVSKVEELELIDGDTDDWFADFIATLGLEKVVADTLISAAQDITRGEMAQLIWGLKPGHEVTPEEDELATIDSCQNLNAQLRKYYKRQNRHQVFYKGGIAEPAVLLESRAVDVAAPQAARSTSFDGAAEALEDSSTAGDFSTTNIQEFGVDEADIIKNDGKYIYMVKGNTIRIISAHPADKLAQVTALKIDGKNFHPREMYVDGKTLVVVGNSNSYDIPIPVGSPLEETIEAVEDFAISARKLSIPGIWPGQSSKYFTEVVSFDLSNIEKPSEIRRVKVEGNQLSSRKIGDIVYLVTNKYQNHHWGKPVPLNADPELPEISDTAFTSEKIAVPCGDIFYFPNFERPNFLIVSAIPVTDTSKKVGRQMLLGGGEQVYASTKNLYVTRTSYRDQFFDTNDWTGWRYWPTTEIYKFALDDNDVDFVARGKVSGRMHNQFSLSEQGDKLRIATQVDRLGSQMAILDADLNLLGKVDGIAPGEDIKAVRYMGDRGYMITFENVDPLFVIDLSTNQPKVLGELKIPGWSDYLHPYGKDHLIGIGKEIKAGAEEDGRLTGDELLGLKLSIFDVSDVKNPKEIHKKIIGDNGTYSEVTHNHKALLIDTEKEIMALPITVQANDGVPREGGWQPTRQAFQGAFVYDLNLTDGFNLRGKATHYADDYWSDEGTRRYGNHEFNIQRILYIGENFYTLSNNIVEAHSWDDVTQINRVQLDNKACSQIHDEDECLQNSCRAVWREWQECYSDDEEDFSKVCEEQKQFERCVEKE